MKNSELEVIRNYDYDKSVDLKRENVKKKYLVGFCLFITVFLFIFGVVFFVKNKIDNYKNLGEDLNFQRQKIIEERMIMEKTLKEERDKLLSLQIEYEDKNRELDDKLKYVNEKQVEFDTELKKVYELRDILKNQLVQIYDFNIDRIYESTNEIDGLDKFTDDDNVENPIHTSTILGKDENEPTEYVEDRILGIAHPDWFIKFDSLGEFIY